MAYRSGMGHWDLALVVESSEGNLIFDSVVHPDYPELSRMHVDAVLGDVISPLAWTLIGPAYEHSQRRLWRSLGALGGTDDRYLFAVRSGGRLHINVSVLRALSARVVGASPKDVDEELGLTPEHPVTVTWRDRVWYPRSAAGTGWTFGVLGWRVHRQRALVRRTVRNGADLESLSTEQLVARVERLRRDDLATVLLPHHGLRMITKVALDRLHERCEDRDVANGLMADLPDLEATEPSRALLRLAQALRATGSLDDIALDGFITRFGHRGVNELDPTAPVWAQQRVQLAELVRRMAASATDDTTISRGPGVRAAARSALRERGFGTRAPVAGDGVAGTSLRGPW